MLSDEQLFARMSMNGKKANYLKLRRGIFEKKHLEVLRGETFRVFVYLCTCANVKRDPMQVAEVGKKQLARVLGIGLNTVRRALTALETNDYIQQVPQGFLIAKPDGEFETDPQEVNTWVQNRPYRDPKRTHKGSETDPSGGSERILRGSKTDPVNAATQTKQNSLLSLNKGKCIEEGSKREEASSTSELAQENPFHFVCYWEDANEHRDFGVKLEPTEKFGDFVVTEAQTLGVDMNRSELARFSQRSIVKFTVTYSKRGRNGKMRGASIGPKRLTEELVGWIRSDLASMGQRQASSPSKSRAKRIDEQTRRLLGK